MTVKFKKTDFTRNLVRRHKLVPHLEKWTSKDITDFSFTYEEKQGDDAWHPSGDCLPSPIALYESAVLRREGVAGEPIGSSLRKTFLVGHFWHQLYQHAVVQLGLADPTAIERIGSKVFGTVQLAEDQYDTLYAIGDSFKWATGQGDVAPCVIPNHGEYVVDFKTMGTHDFKRVGLPNWCAHKYEAQINIYMDFFNLDKALIVAIQKDSPHELKEFEFRRNDELIEAVYEKWTLVGECLSQNEKPNTLIDSFHIDLFGDLSEIWKGPIEV